MAPVLSAVVVGTVALLVAIALCRVALVLFVRYQHRRVARSDARLDQAWTEHELKGKP